jgi:hypothetical protein
MKEFMITAEKSQRVSRSIGELVRHPWRLAAVALLMFLFSVNVYRAATQAITHDEAVTWEWLPFSGGTSVSQFFDSTTANHHPLHNLLAKLSADLFGLSEFSLRIPSLLGGLFYFYTVYLTSAFLFGEGFLFLLSVALLSLNPFLLDYLSCSRGYASGLGFLLFAIYEAMRYLSLTWNQHEPRRPTRILNIIGVAVGLAVGFNVVMIFPCAAVTAAFLVILFGDRMISAPEPVETAVPAHNSKKKKQSKRKLERASGMPVGRNLGQAMLHFVLPAVVVGGFIVSLPRSLIYLEVGYEGPPSLRAILEGIVRPSYLHSPRGGLGLATWFSPEFGIRMVTDFVIPVGLVALIVIAIRIVYNWIERRRLDELPIIDRFLLLLSLAMPAALVLIMASRYIFHAPYPEQRTVLYWIPLLGLTSLSMMKWLNDTGRTGRILAVPVGAFVVLSIAQFVTQFNTRYYSEWAYCAATKDIMAIIRDQHAARAGDKIRLGVTWQLEPGVNFYRTTWGLDWLNKVERESPDGDNDYYILLFNDTELVERRGLKVLLQDKLSGAVLAAPARSRAS